MKEWEIFALDTGTSEIDKAIATYLTDCGKVLRIPNIVFLLREVGGKARVVVDTSFESVERTLAVHHQTVWRSESQRLETAFAQLKVDPASVDLVIFTHLHYDHCGNNAPFRNARFVVQREELRYAFVPLPGEETAYFSPLVGEKPSFWGTRFEQVEGDAEVHDGVRVVLTPGHTPGSQAVLVNSPEGTCCLAGDNAILYENIERRVPVGALYSRRDWFASMDKLRQITNLIYPSHDPLLITNGPALLTRG